MLENLGDRVLEAGIPNKYYMYYKSNGDLYMYDSFRDVEWNLFKLRPDNGLLNIRLTSINAHQQSSRLKVAVKSHHSDNTVSDLKVKVKEFLRNGTLLVNLVKNTFIQDGTLIINLTKQIITNTGNLVINLTKNTYVPDGTLNISLTTTTVIPDGQGMLSIGLWKSTYTPDPDPGTLVINLTKNTYTPDLSNLRVIVKTFST